jgi:hypothetical protein
MIAAVSIDSRDVNREAEPRQVAESGWLRRRKPHA